MFELLLLIKCMILGAAIFFILYSIFYDSVFNNEGPQREKWRKIARKEKKLQERELSKAN